MCYPKARHMRWEPVALAWLPKDLQCCSHALLRAVAHRIGVWLLSHMQFATGSSTAGCLAGTSSACVGATNYNVPVDVPLTENSQLSADHPLNRKVGHSRLTVTTTIIHCTAGFNRQRQSPGPDWLTDRLTNVSRSL
jgi:hypothetical protein